MRYPDLPPVGQPGVITPQARWTLGIIQATQQISKRVLQTDVCKQFPDKGMLFVQLFTTFVVISSESRGHGKVETSEITTQRSCLSGCFQSNHLEAVLLLWKDGDGKPESPTDRNSKTSPQTEFCNQNVPENASTK